MTPSLGLTLPPLTLPTLDSSSNPARLRPEGAFLLCCCHAFRDGALDAQENRTLQQLARALRIFPDQAREIAVTVRQAVQAGRLRGAGPLASEELFYECCRLALQDGRVDASEKRLLLAVAHALSLDEQAAKRAMALARSEAGGARPTRSTEAPVTLPEKAPSPAPTEPADCLLPAEELGTEALPDGPAPTLTERLRLFWEAPGFYLRKLVQGSSPVRRARKVARGIDRLIAGAQPGPVLASTRRRVEGTLRAIQWMEQQLDQLDRYLEGRVYTIDGSDLAAGRPVSSLQPLHDRRRDLQKRLDDTLLSLQRIEDQVAAYVLAAPASSGARALDQELRETLEDLDLLLTASA